MCVTASRRLSATAGRNKPQQRRQKLIIIHRITRMGPKKAAPAKKKDGAPENGGELTPEDRAKLFMLTCQSLQVQLGKQFTQT